MRAARWLAPLLAVVLIVAIGAIGLSMLPAAAASIGADDMPVAP